MAKTSSYSVKTTPKLVVPPPPSAWLKLFPPPPPLFRRDKTSHARLPLPVISDQSLTLSYIHILVIKLIVIVVVIVITRVIAVTVNTCEERNRVWYSVTGTNYHMRA